MIISYQSSNYIIKNLIDCWWWNLVNFIEWIIWVKVKKSLISVIRIKIVKTHFLAVPQNLLHLLFEIFGLGDWISLKKKRSWLGNQHNTIIYILYAVNFLDHVVGSIFDYLVNIADF